MDELALVAPPRALLHDRLRADLVRHGQPTATTEGRGCGEPVEVVSLPMTEAGRQTPTRRLLRYMVLGNGQATGRAQEFVAMLISTYILATVGMIALLALIGVIGAFAAR